MRADLSTRAPWLLRRALHACLVLAGIVPWFVAMLLMSVVTAMSLMAHALWPEANRGNCWSFTLPRWHKHGGYLVIRWSRTPMRYVPHAMWLPEWPAQAPVEQTLPVNRTSKWWKVHRVFYFRFRVAKTERQQ